jgi:D-glycero-D-manno-heptose 1,7-bisphosphate phosphatase
MRKPDTGMSKQAKKDFPEIDFAKSIIVGDSVSDMQFGRNSGMITVFAGDKHKLSEDQIPLVDYFCDSLADFGKLMARE